MSTGIVVKPDFNISSRHSVDDNNGNINKAPIQSHPAYHHHYSQASILLQLCQSCFWCASVFDQLRVFHRCPACLGEGTIDSMPLAKDESYTYDYNDKTGIILSFKSRESKK
jgi:hypothetical protein